MSADTTTTPDILGLFPKDSGELAYADLKEARQFPWFNQLKEQMLPPKFREFESFLSSAGIDPNSQVTELAWALVSKSTTDGSGGSVPSADQIVGTVPKAFRHKKLGPTDVHIMYRSLEDILT